MKVGGVKREHEAIFSTTAEPCHRAISIAASNQIYTITITQEEKGLGS
jgi:hypothetical protein